MPKVSIVMPAYNAARYLGAAIDSVLGQTFADWELVVVDDGSTDSTQEVLDGYRDPRIVRIRQANGGEAAARNTGLNNAHGEYLAFLDADDLYVPDTLAERVRFLDEHPEYGAVVADGFFCDQARKLLGRVSDIRSRDYAGHILEPLLSNPAVVSVPVGVTSRRALIEHLKLRFDTEIGYGTDWDFWIRLSRHAQFGYLGKPTYLYRVHDANMTRGTGRQKVLQDWLRVRIKVLNSDWFDSLSVETRKQFFRDLLIDLLDGRPREQKAILENQRFQNLPAGAKARVLQQVGTEYLTAGSNPDFAASCLRQAGDLDPEDWKSRYLLAGLRLGRLPTRVLLCVWRWARKRINQLRSLGQRRPKAIPSQLRPR